MRQTQMNQVRKTALLIHEALKRGEVLRHDELRKYLEGEGGATSKGQVNAAMKYLRDRGVPVATDRRQLKTTYYGAATGEQMDTYSDRILRDSYSEIVSNVRACDGVHGEKSRLVKQKLLRSAIELGEALGLGAEEVVTECKPLSVRSQRSLDGVAS